MRSGGAFRQWKDGHTRYGFEQIEKWNRAAASFWMRRFYLGEGMMIRLYNTKTLRVEEFKTIHEGHVDMYVCGPTVYNQAHIGNARPMVVFDVLKRLLEAEGYTVTYVSNFTDVDDKIINKAIAEGTSEAVIADRYIEAYKKVRAMLNTQQPDYTPRVTETMEDIIHFIQQLVSIDAAYVGNDGDVYFSVDADPYYGEISHQKLEALEAGARIDVKQDKRNPYDFALWKKTDKGIRWDSPWGKGRPGWHTECVVMINKNLGPLIDIHGGGMDLRFPHHENEAAQQECLHHNALANYWIHNAMINIDGQKMSKSLGNTLWAKDVIQKLGTNLTRWFMSSVHYRKELNLSDEAIETARKELNKVLTPLQQLAIKAMLEDVAVGTEIEEASYRRFLDQLDDDLNTPNAYTVLFETMKKLNAVMRQKETDWTQAFMLGNSVEKMLDILGIVVEKPVITEEDRKNYAAWKQAREMKDFAQADIWRKMLQAKGIAI